MATDRTQTVERSRRDRDRSAAESPAGPGRLHADPALFAQDDRDALLGQQVRRCEANDAAAQNNNFAARFHAFFIADDVRFITRGFPAAYDV